MDKAPGRLPRHAGKPRAAYRRPRGERRPALTAPAADIDGRPSRPAGDSPPDPTPSPSRSTPSTAPVEVGLRPLVGWRPLLRPGPIVVLLVGSVLLALILDRARPHFALSQPIIRLFDEGNILDAAARAANGEVPYRDFWFLYSPGQLYALAALFKMFGMSVPVEWTWDVGVRALLCLAVYALAGRLTSPVAAVIPFAIVALWLVSTPFYSYAMFPTLALALLSMLSFLSFIARRRPSSLLASGVLAGLTGAFRHDVGFYVAASASLVLTLSTFFELRHTLLTPAAIVRRLAAAHAPYLLGLAVAALPVVAFLLLAVPIEDLWHAFVYFPLVLFRNAHYLPPPPLLRDLSLFLSGDRFFPSFMGVLRSYWLPFYMPLLVYPSALMIVLVLFARSRGRAEVDRTRLWGMLLILFLGLALFNQALNRTDRIHLLPTAITGLILLTALVHNFPRRWLPEHVLVYAPVALPILLATYVLEPVGTVRKILQAAPVQCAAVGGRDHLGCVSVYTDQTQAIRFVQERVGPTERIFVGNSRHDRVLPNDAMFYFLSGLKNASRFDDLVSSRVDTPDTQRRIIDELRANAVRYVVLFSGSSGFPPEPNAGGRGPGATLLDDFIRANYGQVAQFRVYTIWERR